MEQVRRKMEEARRRRNTLAGDRRTDTEFQVQGRAALPVDMSDHRRFQAGRQAKLFLGGVAAGGAVMAISWWLLVTAMPGGSARMPAGNALRLQQDYTTYDTRWSTEAIARLNERIGSLHDSVTSLEVTLMRIRILADAIGKAGGRHVAVSRQAESATAEAESIFANLEPTAAGTVAAPHRTASGFHPTHTVNARLNLRPAAALDNEPVRVLDAGTRVEYIRARDDWYYVNTGSGEKGWCAASYLSALNSH